MTVDAAATGPARVDSRARRAAHWATARDQRWFLLAVAAALLLRLAWVFWLHTAEPIEATSDTGRNLAMARQFSDLQTYRLNGLVSAFNPPGYALALTPLAALSRATGWFTLPLAAALVNVAAGTATVALGGTLARQWFGRRARTAAAWLLALAAGPIYLTAVALSETAFTALVLGVLVLVSRWLLGRRTVTTGAVVAVGALIGFTALVRPPGLLLLPIAALALAERRGGWRGAARPVLALLVGALLVVAPWTIRNVVQVGALTPVSTNSAAFVCQGHGPDAKADVDDMTYDDFAHCFRGSPFDPTSHDESAWSSRITRRAVGWALTHPAEEVELTWDKTWAVLVNDHQALADARDGGRREIGSQDTVRRLDRLGEWWHRVVLVGGLLALVALPRARRAWPLWATAVAMVMAVWVGNALDRYHHTTMALLAVFAGALLVSLPLSRVWRSATLWLHRQRTTMKERRTVAQEQREQEQERRVAGAQRAAPTSRREPVAEEPEVVLTPDEAMAQAAEPAGWWAGRSGRPLHPVVAAVAIGAWVCAFGFDLISQVADTAWVYARAAYVLTAAGVAVGAVAATIGLVDLVRIQRDTPAFRTGVRHLLVMDGCLVLFAVSFLIRRTSDFEWHDPVGVAPMGLSILGLVLLGVGVWFGTQLAYGYGVRVALDEDRRRGFEVEPAPGPRAAEPDSDPTDVDEAVEVAAGD